MPHCQSCKAPIMWAFSAATGKRMPIDRDPVVGGNVDLIFAADNTPTAFVVEAVAGEMRHVSHFATCPNAKQHRARGRR